jgi:site-specific recombinase XerD
VKAPLPNTLARAIRDFFTDHLPRVRGLSPHTVQSYRDSLVLLLRFIASCGGRGVAEIDIDHLGPGEVLDFLNHLEAKRKNGAGTRNVRLAAIHAFFRYVAARHPDRLEQCQRILAVPFKRTRPRAVEYLEYDEIQAVLGTVDRATFDGRRDYALLATMFNTGARVQEVLDLRPCDVQLIRPHQVRLFGKGRKERFCPLWPQTAQLLQEYLRERRADPASQDPIFQNHRRQPLTRFGVRYILRKYCIRARPATPTLKAKRLHPHSMRHSTAVHLLRSRVDLVTISRWLGHASVDTTNRYTAVDLEMKREAIAKARPVGEVQAGLSAWRTDSTILAWLESL